MKIPGNFCAKLQNCIRIAMSYVLVFRRRSMIHFKRSTAPLLWSKIVKHFVFVPKVNSAYTSCKNCQSLRILYFGSDKFSIGPLSKLLLRMRQSPTEGKLIDTIDIVASESPLLDRAMKRQKTGEFMEYIKQENLKVFPWSKDISSKILNYDYGIVASFGHLIPRKIIQLFKRGMINAHPSLLPRWHGAAPIIHTILNGDSKTGVTIIDLSIGRFDKGKIFMQKEFEIDQQWTTDMLTGSLSNLAGDMVLQVLDSYDYYASNAWPQIEEGASQATKISTELSYIRWEDQNCIQLDRLHRAIGEKIGLHTYFDGKLVKLLDIKFLARRGSEEMDKITEDTFVAGRSWYDRKTKELFIKCKDGWMKVSSLQVQYKKPIRPVDFYNAYMVDKKKTGDFKDHFSSNLAETSRNKLN